MKSPSARASAARSSVTTCQPATGTGAAYDVVPTVGPNAENAAGTGSSDNATAALGPSPAEAAGTGAAYDVPATVAALQARAQRRF